MIGAEAIRELLKGLELEKLEASLRVEMQETESDIKHKKLAKRLKNRRGVPLFRQQAGVDDPHGGAGDFRRICVRWCRSMAAASRPRISTISTAASSTATTA